MQRHLFPQPTCKAERHYWFHFLKPRESPITFAGDQYAVRKVNALVPGHRDCWEKGKEGLRMALTVSKPQEIQRIGLIIPSDQMILEPSGLLKKIETTGQRSKVQQSLRAHSPASRNPQGLLDVTCPLWACGWQVKSMVVTSRTGLQCQTGKQRKGNRGGWEREHAILHRPLWAGGTLESPGGL